MGIQESFHVFSVLFQAITGKKPFGKNTETFMGPGNFMLNIQLLSQLGCGPCELIHKSWKYFRNSPPSRDAPPHSYIDVNDFSSIEDLANYLKSLMNSRVNIFCINFTEAISSIIEKLKWEKLTILSLTFCQS